MNTSSSDTKLSIPHTSHVRGIIIGVLILALALIFCALYLWGSMLSPAPTPVFTPPTNTEPETPRADADIQILKTVSGSDEISSIATDIESTNLDSLDTELELIERDLES